MLFRKERKRSVAEIPTVSMADIAFLLIVFFMTTTIFSREKGLKMLLPEKGETVKIRKENIMEILVNPYGEVLIEDEKLALPQLREKIEKALGINESLVFAVKISSKAPYKVAIDVLDELKLAKATRISFVPIEEE